MLEIEKSILAKSTVINEYNYPHQSEVLSKPYTGAEMQWLEEQGLKNTYSYETGATVKIHPSCITCQARHIIKYRTHPNAEGKNPFNIRCKGIPGSLPPGSETEIKRFSTEKGVSSERAQRLFKSSVDPVAWAELMFGFNDKDPKWKLRWYQKEVLRCSSMRMVLRWGRRSGKSFSMALKLLYNAFTQTVSKGLDAQGKEVNAGPQIIVATPFQAQLTNIFDEMEKLLKRNVDLSNRVKSKHGGSLYTKSPFFLLELTNGATISGFVTGVEIRQDGSAAGSLRGQCLPGETQILLANGENKEIKDVIIGDIVIGLDKNGHIVESPITHVFQPNTKQAFEIKLASGRSFTSSADHSFAGFYQSRTQFHRLNTQNRFELQWSAVKNMKVGDYVALATKLREIPASFTDNEIYMLGLMAGDGSCGPGAIKRRDIKFTTANEKTIFGFLNLLNNLGIACSLDSHKPNAIDIRVNTRGDVGRFEELLTRGGIAGSYSYEKKLNPSLISGTADQKRLLLGALLSTDGWITTSGDAIEVGYITTSKELAAQVIELFQGLGAIARVRVKPKGKYRDQYHIAVKSSVSVLRALTGVYVLGKQDKVIEALRIAEQNIEGSHHSHQYLNDHFVDRIVSITPLNDQVMYDIEVAGIENFLIKGGVVTHNSANIIYIDEMDMIPEEVLEKVIIPILATSEETAFYATSTPIGKAGKFYDLVFNRPDFKEMYLPSTVLPHWDSFKNELEYANVEDDGFKAEYMAVFVESAAGVFKADSVYKAMRNYTYIDSAPDETGWWRTFAGVKNRSADLVTVVGIDWNKNAGSEFVVICYDQKNHRWWIAESTNIDPGKFNSVRFKDEVWALNMKWKPDFFYADEGYGHHIIDDIHYEAHRLNMLNSHPDSEIRAKLTVADKFKMKLNPDRFKKFNFSQKVELVHPVDNTLLERTGKEFLVENAMRVFEEERIGFPAEEATLRTQMLNYVVLRRNKVNGRPIYGMKNPNVGDHRLDAMMLALGGLFLERHPLYSRSATVAGADPGLIKKDALAARYGGEDVDNQLPAGLGMKVLNLSRGGSPEQAAQIAKLLQMEHGTGSIPQRVTNRSEFPGRNGRAMKPKTPLEQLWESAPSYNGYEDDTRPFYEAKAAVRRNNPHLAGDLDTSLVTRKPGRSNKSGRGGGW